MKFFLMATVAALVLGSVFHEDISRSFSIESSGSQTSFSPTASVRNLGSAMNNNMQGIGRALGQ